MCATTLFLVFTLHTASALIGYDCGGATLNVSTFSLLNLPPCELNTPEPSTENEEIQLLQLADFDLAETSQCKIEIDRTIYYCGMHSHSSIVQNGRQQYLHHIDYDSCKTLLATGAVSITPAVQVAGVRVNSTTARSITLSGTTSIDGTCAGSAYSDPFGTWSNVVVQALVRITLRKFQAPVNLKTDQIALPSGQRCGFQTGACLDTEDGNTFWEAFPSSQCTFKEYDVLYEGPATKIFHHDENTIIHTATEGDTTFTLAETRSSTMCGYKLIHTEHPKLFILNTASGKFKSKTAIPTSNLDLFTYINAKFLYVERHLRTQLIQLYKDTVTQKCRLEQQVIKNMMSIINIAPEDVANTLAKGPGHLALQAGEVIHIVKCIAVTVVLRKTETCFQELPVSYKNQSFFLTPRNRILTPYGTRRPCSELLPTMYELHGTWYKLLPRPSEGMAPPNLGRITQSQWKYIDPSNLATGGIYSPDELENLKDHVMFPLRKISIIDDLAQGAAGQNHPTDNFKLYNLFDEHTLSKIAESTAKRMWNSFTTFGSISAGLLGIFITCKLVKQVISTILNGITLHAAYGCSLRLLAATWSSLTHFCIHLQKKENVRNSPVRECVPPIYSEIPELIDNPQVPTPTVREPTIRQLRDSFRHPFPRSYRRPDTTSQPDDSN